MSGQVDSAELTRAFRRGFAITLGVDLVTKVFGAATVVVLIRGLSVSSYAYATLFLTLAQFAGSAAGGGVRTHYLREEAEHLSRGGEGEREELFLDSLLRGTALILIIGVCAVPLVWICGFGAEYMGAAAFAAYATAFAVGFAAAELAIARYQARRRFAAAGAISAARAAALLVAAVLVLVTGQSVLVLSLWLVASMAVVGAAAAGPAARRGGRLRLRRSRAGWLSSEEAWLSFYYLAAAGFAYVDVMVAGALLDQRQVATLGASLRYLALIQSPIPALGAVLRVRTSQIDVIDSFANQRTMILTWFRRTALAAALLVGGAGVLAPVLIAQIDGGKYPGSVVVFQILLVTALSAYLTAPGVSILIAQRQYVILAAVYAVGLLLNLVGDVVVAKRYGVEGIAVVSSTVYVGVDVVLTGWALRSTSRARR